MQKISSIAILAVVLLSPARTAFADTLIVIGVAVDKTGQRIPGALVKLYATSNTVKEPLTEDRTSERGIFSLYRTNIAGDIGELFIVYEGGQDRVAEPLKVALRPVRNGFVEARTSDLIILTVPQNATLTSEEATERIAAVTHTQAVLVEAGATDKVKATEVVSARTAEISTRIRPGQLKMDLATGQAIKHLNGLDPAIMVDLNKAVSQAIRRD